MKKWKSILAAAATLACAGVPLRAAATAPAATSFTVPNSGIDVRRVYAIYGGKDAYIASAFATRNVLFGAISKEGVKDVKIALSEKVYFALGKTQNPSNYNTVWR